MTYRINVTDFEWEIIAEGFNFDTYYRTGEFDATTKFPVDREAWQGTLPVYLHGIGDLPYDYLIQRGQAIVTAEPIFAIFSKTDLTFQQMIEAIRNAK
jgi:hypothetical protein